MAIQQHRRENSLYAKQHLRDYYERLERKNDGKMADTRTKAKAFDIMNAKNVNMRELKYSFETRRPLATYNYGKREQERLTPEEIKTIEEALL